jgi:hypothetical protein
MWKEEEDCGVMIGRGWILVELALVFVIDVEKWVWAWGLAAGRRVGLVGAREWSNSSRPEHYFAFPIRILLHFPPFACWYYALWSA